MATLVHPKKLSAYKQYRQACSLLRETSRATSSAWYQQALEQDFQLHIRIDGTAVHTFFHNRPKNEWSAGPPLTEQVIADPEQVASYVEQLLVYVRALKATSVGVILHIADEFATAELRSELNNPGALPDLRETAFHSPREILADSSVSAEQTSWRVLPYPAAGAEVVATTVTISRRLDPFLSVFRQVGERRNFPIICQALSSPLVAIMGLPAAVEPVRGKAFAAILQYPCFTALAFFNEHSDLRLIRTLPHRGLRRPPNLRQAIITTVASLEFIDPDLFIFPLGGDVDTRVEADLKESFPESTVDTASFSTPSPLSPWIPEPALSIQVFPENQVEGSHTFGVIRAEKWFLQDFLPASKEVLEHYPTRNEMRMLRVLKFARIGVAVMVLLGTASLGLGIFSIIRRPEWKFNTGDAIITQQKLGKLTLERQRFDHWNNLLEDRSKAWVSMEATARLFPAKSGLLIKSINHTVRPDAAAGQAKVGFIREWTFTGLARKDAIGYLNSLNSREAIAARFSEIAKATGNTAFDPTPNTRTLAVNVKTQENGNFQQMPAEDIDDSDETTYAYTFNLTITQRFVSTDPLAITAAKAP